MQAFAHRPHTMTRCDLNKEPRPVPEPIGARGRG